jgi:ABC-type lipoprotein release transport system permease subunit
MAFLRFLIQRTRRHWQMFLTVSMGVILATTLLASGPLLVDTVIEFGLQSTLRTSDPQIGNLCLAASVRLAEQKPGEFEALDRQVRELLQERFGPYLDRIVLSVSSYWLLPWTEGELATEHRVNIRTYQDLEQHVEFVAGEWPTGVAEADQIPVVIGEEMAQHYELGVGDLLPLSFRTDENDPSVWLQVSGIVRARDLRSAYWFGESSPLRNQASKRWATQYNAILPAEAFHSTVNSLFPVAHSELDWYLLLAPAKITTPDIPLLQQQIASLKEQLLASQPRLIAQTGLDSLLAQFATLAKVIRPPLYLLTSEVVLLVLYYVVMVATLAVGQVEQEFAVLRSRGSSGGQIVALQLGEASLIGLVALVSGPLLAYVLIQALAAFGPLADVRASNWSLELTWSAWLAAGVGVVACVAGMLLPLVPALRRSIVTHQQVRTRPTQSAWWQRMYLDVFALLIGMILLWRLQLHGGIVTSGISATGVDWLLLLSPLVLLLGAATILLRITPLLLRLVARLAARRPGLPGALAMWQASRNPAHVARLVLLLTLAMALGILSTGLNATLDVSESERARYAAGGEVRLVSGSLVPLSGISSTVGVNASAAVWRIEGTANTGSYRSLPHVEILAVEPSSFAAVTAYRDDFAGRPVGELLGDLVMDEEQAVGALALPGRPTGVGLWLWAPDDKDARGSREYLYGDSDHDRVSLRAKILTAQGEMLSIRFQPSTVAADASGWRYFEAPLSGFSVASYPLRMHSIWIQNRTKVCSREGCIPQGRISMNLAIDDVTVVDADSGERVMVDSFEDPTRIWAVAEPSLSPSASRRAFRSRFDRTNPHSGNVRQELTLDYYKAYQTVRFSPIEGMAGAALPALASSAFLEATDLQVGDVTDVWISSLSAVPFRIVGAVEYFPTMYERRTAPAASQNTGYMVAPRDAVLARLNDRSANPLNANEVWLAVDDGFSPDELGASLPMVIQIWEAEAVRLALKASPIGLGLRSVTLFGYVLTALLSLVGFATYFYMNTRQREAQYGVLRSMGLSATQLYGSLIVEQVILIVSGLAFGTVLGLLLNQLVLPDLPIGLGDRPPVPPFYPQEDWLAVGRIYLTLMLAFLASLGIATALLVRGRIHRVLRIGQE